MKGPRRIVAWGMAWSLLWVLACASGPPAQEAVAPPPPAKPVTAPLPAAPPGPAQRVCLWVFWTDNSTLLKEALAMLDQGQPFQTVALTVARNNKKYATTQADCLDREQLPPAMTAAIKDLKLGQVSRPFALNRGTALAMLTSDAFRRQARQLYEAGKYKQAMEQLKLDLELHPAAINSWHLLALCRAATNDRAGALTAYDRALEWKPDDPALLNDKATLLMQMDRPDQAVVLYRRALAGAPNNPVYLNNLAWALVGQKRELDQALDLATRASRLAPDNASVWDTLGQVQQAMGDHARAVISFHHAARLAPGSPEVKQRMLSSLLALKPGQVDKLNHLQDTTPAAPAPAKPAAKPKPAPQPKPEPESKPPAPQQPPVAAEPKPELKPKPEPNPPVPAPAPKQPPVAAQPPAPPAPPAPQPSEAPAPPKAQAPAPAPAAQPPAKAEPKPEPPARAKPPIKPAPPAKPKPKPPAQAKAPARAPAEDLGRPPRGWYLQLSSNRSAKLAVEARDEWASKGHGAHVWAWRSPTSGVWNRLLLGPFSSKLKALVRGDMLKQAGELKTYVLIRVP